MGTRPAGAEGRQKRIQSERSNSGLSMGEFNSKPLFIPFKILEKRDFLPGGLAIDKIVLKFSSNFAAI